MVIGIPALFAADAPSGFDFNNPSQFLPYAIGAVLTIGVIAIGFAFSGKKSAGGEQAEDGSAEQPAGTRSASKPLEKLVLPVLGAMLTCGVVGVLVLSVTQGFSDAQKSLNSAVQAPVLSDFRLPQTPAVPPIQSFQFQPPPQIHIPNIQPTPPRIPQVYIDSRGVIRPR